MLSAEDHLLEDAAMSYAYLSLPSLSPNNIDENKKSRGKLKKTSRSEENHGDISVIIFWGYLLLHTYNADTWISIDVRSDRVCLCDFIVAGNLKMFRSA